MFNNSIVAVVLGYAFGMAFFAGFFYLLLCYSRKTLRRPPRWSLLVAQWIVTPILVAVGALIAFGALDQNILMALAGYVASRLVRFLKIQRGETMSNDEMLNAIYLTAIEQTPEGRRAVEEVLNRRNSK